MVRAGAPFTDETYPERGADCALALAPAFVSLVDLAQTLGWGRDEVALALATLADNHRQVRNPKQSSARQRLGLHLTSA